MRRGLWANFDQVNADAEKIKEELTTIDERIKELTTQLKTTGDELATNYTTVVTSILTLCKEKFPDFEIKFIFRDSTCSLDLWLKLCVEAEFEYSGLWFIPDTRFGFTEFKETCPVNDPFLYLFLYEHSQAIRENTEFICSTDALIVGTDLDTIVKNLNTLKAQRKGLITKTVQRTQDFIKGFEM